jgi:replicative DNA helicase
VTPFTFDVGFQRAVLRLMQVDDVFFLRAIEWLTPEHFTTEPHGWIFRVFAQHYRDYHQRCTDLVIRDAVRRLPQQVAVRYAAEVENMIALGLVPESLWVKAQLAEFIKQALFAEAHQASAQLFNQGKRQEAYDVTASAQERIIDVTFDDVDRIWLFDELPERQLARVRAQMDPLGRSFTTGIPQLDQITEGGCQRGEVWAVFAYAKRCKSTWLLNQGFHATRLHRRQTVHFVLEGRGEQIAARYDACFSQELYTAVKRGEITSQLYQQLASEYAGLRRLLVIRTLNDWDVTILDLQRELHYLKSQGVVPEMMIVDYMDLGRSRDRVDSETQHQVAFARDLKRLVNNTEVACWTAWQAVRPPKGAHTKEHVLTSSNVADAYAKVRIVDAFGSLNATDEEMERNEMRVFFEGHRDSPVNKLWTITNDLARMRMITSAVEYIPKDEAA